MSLSLREAMALGRQSDEAISSYPTALGGFTIRPTTVFFLLSCLDERIAISMQAVEDIEQTFTLVAANLRSPTLRRLSVKMCRLLDSPGAVVVAGIRVEERADVLSAFRRAHLQCEWTEEENGWVGAVLKAIGK